MRRLLRLALAATLATGLAWSTGAGVIVTKTNAIAIGEITDNGDFLLLKTQYGSNRYAKDKVLWFNAAADIKSMFQAGRRAQELNELEIAKMLYSESLLQEPDTKSKAMAKLKEMQAVVAAKKQAEAAAAEGATEGDGDQPVAEGAAPVRPNFMVKALKEKLTTLEEGKLVPYEAGKLAAKQFVVLYFARGGEQRCQEFTPLLTQLCQTAKKQAPDLVEVVFCSRDRDEKELLADVTKEKITWPVLTVSQVADDDELLGEYLRKIVPSLVVVDREGKIVADSYKNERYVGADKALRELTERLNAPPAPPHRKKSQ